MKQKIERLKKQLEDKAELHRDAYNQAIGALHILKELEQPDALSEQELGRLVGGQVLSFDPVGSDKTA